MDGDAVDAVVRETVGLLLGRRIAPGEHVARGQEPDWDSLKHIEIVFAVEGACDVRFPEDELGTLTDIEGIVEAVLAHRAA